MPSTTSVKAPTVTQRAVLATAQIRQIVGRDDLKLLSAALSEAAVQEAQRNPSFVRCILEIYDDLASKANTRSGTRTKSEDKTRKQLVPISEPGELNIGPNDKPDAYILQKMYGNGQLRDALDGYSLAALKDMAEEVMRRNPNTKPKTKSKKNDVIDYIVAQLTV